MTSAFHLPPAGFGPGSQPAPEDGAELDYLALPSGMRTFEAHLPEVDDPDAVAPALAVLAELSAAAAAVAEGGPARRFDLGEVDARSRALLFETLGEGEVSARLEGPWGLTAQETVFAGVWIVSEGGAEQVEVAPIPATVAARAFQPTVPAVGPLAPRGAGVVNAPAIVTELMDRSRGHRAGDPPHVVNLSLLPHTPEDLQHLDAALGRGAATLLSRGYGNCRIAATGLANVWRVAFYNSMDALILDTFEVTTMPEVALAAPEDLADSADRLLEVLEAIR